MKAKLLWICAAVVTAAMATLFFVNRSQQCANQQLNEPMLSLDSWQLTDHYGNAFGSEQVAGKVWIANFFFTRCPSICPELTRKMDALQKQFQQDSNDLVLLSFSIDPEHDTPYVLQTYQTHKQVNTQKSPPWHFITGSKRDMYSLVVGQMKLHVGKKQGLQDGSGRFDIPHVSHLALFDRQSNLRGLFAIDEQGLGELKQQARMLLSRR